MSYNESSEEDDFNSVDSSFNKTVDEDNSVEAEKKKYKTRSLLAEVTYKLSKLSHSSPVGEEIVNEGVVVGEAELDLNMPDPVDEVNFEDENAADGAKALEYSRTLLLEYNAEEVLFWFMQLENEMFTCEVKSQWLKRCILVKNLPPKVQADVKSLLVLQKAQAPGDIYKKIKKEILRIHAPVKEETYKKALTRVLVGLPSQLGQVLINDICDKPVKLEGCCCAKAVFCLWSIQCPLPVRSHCATMEFNHETYQRVFEEADKVFLSTKTTEVSAGVAAVSLNALNSTDQAQVSAIKQNKGQNRNNNKNNKQNSGSGQSKPESSKNSNSSGTRTGNRGKRHSSNPPGSCCDNHYKWGPDSWFCLEPLTCPWVSKVAAKPKETKN